MSSPSLAAAVLSVKRRALKAKNDGDIEQAKRFLIMAKQLESLTDPLELKKLALQFQQEGDLEEAAAQALQKAGPSAAEETPQEPPEEEPQEPVYENPVNDAIDAANLEEISGGTAFTDDEMLDVDTMSDMKDAGMDIPPQEKYLDRAKFHRQKAIEHRDGGNLATAKKYLLLSKKFEAAAQTLFSGSNILEKDEDDGEDYSLLDELMGDGSNTGNEDDGFMDQLFGTSNNAVTLDDLDDLDPSMLRDMMEAGMEIPDVDEVRGRATQKKADALAFKKDGNLVAAKAALEESKRLEGKANRLSDLLTQMTSGASIPDDPDAMLEAMMATELAPTQQKKAATAAKEPEGPKKTSMEYKIEAVKFKKEGNMAEATAALRLFKQALAAEASAAQAAKRKEAMQLLEAEMKLAKEQIVRFDFYKRFVDKESDQMEVWHNYLQQCQKGVKRLVTETLELERSEDDTNTKQIAGEGLSFVGSINPKEERLEVTILKARDLLNNKKLLELLKKGKDKKGTARTLDSCIRLKLTVQLSPEEGSTLENATFTLTPSSGGDSYCLFEDGVWVNTKRGTSRFAKTIVRKLATKRLLVEVMYTPPAKGLFWSSSPEETLLGTAVIKLKDLLSQNYIAGDFPLLDPSKRKEVGGSLRLALRTGLPFAIPTEKKKKGEEEEDIVPTTGYSPVSLIPYPGFFFAGDENDVDEN